MPYDSRAYRILIASPSDVEEERELAVKVIQEWNDLYSYTRGVVLLPLRWETHSAPEFGTRPQEVINRAIVDQCDLLVGIFWARIGSPTGLAESGTLEEIARVAKAGKPIMLYFSKVPIDPGSIDLGQLDKLKRFKAETYPNALTESYKTHVEFRDKFARQIELKVRDLQREDGSGQPPPLTLAIASPGLKALDGTSATRELELLDVLDLDAADSDQTAAGKTAIKRKALVEAIMARAATTPVVLAISNTGSSGFRNLYVEALVVASADVEVTDKPPAPPSLFYITTAHFESTINLGITDWAIPDVAWDAPQVDEGFRKTEEGWQFSFEWPALQPQRVRWVMPVLYVRAKAAARVELFAKVFADSLPEPVLLKAELELTVRSRVAHVRDVIGKTVET
jgi:hypothetical protein